MRRVRPSVDGVDNKKCDFLQWYSGLADDAAVGVATVPAPQRDKLDNVATVVATLAFEELLGRERHRNDDGRLDRRRRGGGGSGAGLNAEEEAPAAGLSRIVLLNALKDDDSFIALLRPLLALPGCPAVGAAVEAMGQPGADSVTITDFVGFFEKVASTSIRRLSPRRRRSPRRTRASPSPTHGMLGSPVEAEDDDHGASRPTEAGACFIRKRIDPDAVSPALWNLPTARGSEPIGYGFVPIRTAHSLPRLPTHHRHSPTPTMNVGHQR